MATLTQYCDITGTDTEVTFARCGDTVTIIEAQVEYTTNGIVRKTLMTSERTVGEAFAAHKALQAKGFRAA